MRLIALPGNDELAARLGNALNMPCDSVVYRRFPDGESYLRIDADLRETSVALIATLNQPDARIPAVLFAADLARDLGATRVGLVCPYLCYMRQDQRFRPGEALTSRSFARWLSDHFDWLVTVDPHLHRYASLDEIYRLESSVVTAAPAIADWIKANVEAPVLIGPDAESEQWIRAVAGKHDWPWRVFEKKRHGDREVSMALPDLEPIAARRPVLVDDIIASGSTIALATRHLLEAGLAAPLVIGVHGLHDEGTLQALRAAGIARLVCTNSVPGPQAEIDLSGLLAEPIRRLADD
ncbi:MAG: ribose-phosphate diphosphokinase [Wenzhouxiangella sp.]|nr:MAG: ribose-phosphate diphosphokinase [Wenzhouxiangella sp.]